jgi:mRNA-degrading endonuclease HigB of HigAB toxin-antitoxin module
MTQPPLNMAGKPMCLSSFSKPTLEHSVFSSKILDKFAISHTEWVIDIGATDHMVINTQYYTSMQVVHNLNVTLPNGQSVVVTHIGSIQVTSSLLLTDVLCVPSFDFNLISVSKLTKSLHCCIFFLSNYCFIQDLMHWRMIGMGKQQNALYILDLSSNSKHVVAHTSTTNLQSFMYSLSSVKHIENNVHVWHCRLGHPSFSKMSFLSDIVPNVSHSCKDNHVCTVCPLAK